MVNAKQQGYIWIIYKEDNAGLCIDFFFLFGMHWNRNIKRVFKERLKINNF